MIDATTLTIKGTFPSLNEFIGALNSRNRNVGNNFKRRIEKRIIEQVKEQRKEPFKTPVTLQFFFYEPNKRRDYDNVFSVFIKCFQDALVKNGYLPNDGWKQINGDFQIGFAVDADDPRVIVTIIQN